MPHRTLRIQQMVAFSQEIQRIQDVDVLLERILTSARKLVNADAGTIYVKNGDNLKFSHSQNDTLQQRLPSGKKLMYKSFMIPVNHNSISGYAASTGETLNIPDVYQLDKTRVSYMFNRAYDKEMQYRTQSMLTIPLKNSARNVVGVIQLINAQNEQGEVIPFTDKDIPLVRLFARDAALAIERAQMTRTEILGMIQFLTKIRDPEETEAHVNRVGAFSSEIYEAWAHKQGLPRAMIEAQSETLRIAAMLHDIGKIAIPKGIREKSGKFTAKEYETMKQHTIKGARMLLKSAQTDYEKAAAEIALNHHEFWDGSGYPGHIDIDTGLAIPGYETPQGKPRSKRGAEIPIFARIVAVVDVYDALSCRRVFREAMGEDDVLKILKRGAGRRFDPDVIEAFFDRLETIHVIAHRFPEEGK